MGSYVFSIEHVRYSSRFFRAFGFCRDKASATRFCLPGRCLRYVPSYYLVVCIFWGHSDREMLMVR